MLFGLIYVIVRLTGGHLGFGFFIGVIGLLVLAYGAYGLYSSGPAATALKELQASGRRDTD